MNNKSLLILLLIYFSVGIVYASNTAGVHGPIIKANDSSFNYRLGFSPGDDGATNRYAHRLHYQQAIDESFRWRVVGQFTDRGAQNSFELDFIRAELLWFFRPKKDDNWNSGLRFDLRARKGSRPEQFAIHWTNEWQLSSKWRLRGILISGWNFRGTGKKGMTIDTSTSLAYQLDNGHRVGVEMFNVYGLASDMPTFDEQSHQLGPVLSGKIGELNYQLGYLAGVSKSAEDHTFRLWFGKSF